jgi:hypothetical protein
MLLDRETAVPPTTRPSYAAAFSIGLTNPDSVTPFGVVGPDGKDAARGYYVYRNNVTVSLIAALASIYPAVQRITGAEFFRAMARFHLRETPPRSPVLFEYGRDFPDFIERYEYARPMPWLGDTARIERAWLDAYHAADSEPLRSAALAVIPSEQLANAVFQVHPATRIVRSRYAAATIFAANRASDAVARINAAIAENALITRPRLEVVVRRLPCGGATFLESLAAGGSLGQAAAGATLACPSFDISRAIVDMLDAGAFTAVALGDLP